MIGRARHSANQTRHPILPHAIAQHAVRCLRNRRRRAHKAPTRRVKRCNGGQDRINRRIFSVPQGQASAGRLSTGRPVPGALSRMVSAGTGSLPCRAPSGLFSGGCVSLGSFSVSSSPLSSRDAGASFPFRGDAARASRRIPDARQKPSSPLSHRITCSSKPRNAASGRPPDQRTPPSRSAVTRARRFPESRQYSV